MRQIADLIVLNDGGVVVKDEGTVQTIGISEDDGHRNDRRAPPDAAQRRSHRCCLSRSLHSMISSYSHIHIHEGSASVDQPMVQREDRELETRKYAELVENRRQVALDG